MGGLSDQLLEIIANETGGPYDEITPEKKGGFKNNRIRCQFLVQKTRYSVDLLINQTAGKIQNIFLSFNEINKAFPPIYYLNYNTSRGSVKMYVDDPGSIADETQRGLILAVCRKIATIMQEQGK